MAVDIQMNCRNWAKLWGSGKVALSFFAERHALLTETMIGLVGGLAFNMYQANHEAPWRFMESLDPNAAHPIRYAHKLLQLSVVICTPGINFWLIYLLSNSRFREGDMHDIITHSTWIHKLLGCMLALCILVLGISWLHRSFTSQHNQIVLYPNNAELKLQGASIRINNAFPPNQFLWHLSES